MKHVQEKGYTLCIPQFIMKMYHSSFRTTQSLVRIYF